MRAVLVSLVLAIAASGYAQSPGKPTAIGNCNIVISGNNNTVQTANALTGRCGIGKEQGNKIIQLLNTVLAKKDVGEINAKLDQLIAMAAKPALIVNCGNAGNCAGTNNGTQVYNQYGAPKLLMTDSQRTTISDAMKVHTNPGVAVSCQISEDASPYATQLANALHDAGMNITEPTCAMMLGNGGNPIPSGVSFVVGKNRVQDAKTLAIAMQTAGLTDSPVTTRVEDANPDWFEVLVTSNH
jgi:hypothetical protein